MIKQVRFSFIVWFLILVSVSNVYALDPIPSKLLFKIERSRDSNQVIYELNLNPSGEIIDSLPIKIYWELPGKKHQNLSIVQQRFGYGLRFLDSDNNESEIWKFQFVSYPFQKFILKKTQDNSFKVFTNWKGNEIIVDQIFIQFENDSFWFPVISNIQLKGTIVSTGTTFADNIKP